MSAFPGLPGFSLQRLSGLVFHGLLGLACPTSLDKAIRIPGTEETTLSAILGLAVMRVSLETVQAPCMADSYSVSISGAPGIALPGFLGLACPTSLCKAC